MGNRVRGNSKIIRKERKRSYIENRKVERDGGRSSRKRWNE